MWRWVWRTLAVVGAIALGTVLAFGVVREVQLHREVAHICRQFNSIDCAHHPDSYNPMSTYQPWDESRIDQLENRVEEICYEVRYAGC